LIADFWIKEDTVNHKTWINLKPCPNQSQKIQNRKWLALFTIAVALMMCAAGAQAQQPTKIPRIGYLDAVPFSSNAARSEAFRQGLRELGYVEGKNIVVEQRWAQGKIDLLAPLAAELLRLNTEIIVTAGPTVTRALINLKTAKQISLTIPPNVLARADRVIK
jgi:putative ABC transport system substrate-binding protein